MRVAYKWQAALVVALGVFMPVLEVPPWPWHGRTRTSRGLSRRGFVARRGWIGAHANRPLVGPPHRLPLWTQRVKKAQGLAGVAATGVKIAPPDAILGLTGLISDQDVHSSTSEG
jgi:hypothetical protein